MERKLTMASQYMNGTYNGYNRNNKERDDLDYYATPPAEVLNILNVIKPNLSNKTILEPCIGGGHMLDSIIKYCNESGATGCKFIGTDLVDRGYRNDGAEIKYALDFTRSDYPYAKADVVIANPPYSLLEKFLVKMLGIAQEELIVLARLQGLEGLGRYKNVWSKHPCTDVYVYVDRINCWKNGIAPAGSSAQAYAWFRWRMQEPNPVPTLHWINAAKN